MCLQERSSGPLHEPARMPGLGEDHQGRVYDELYSDALLQTPSLAFALRVSFRNSNPFPKDWSFASLSFWRKMKWTKGIWFRKAMDGVVLMAFDANVCRIVL